VVANRPAKHRISGFERVEHSTLRGLTINMQLNFAVDLGELSQVLWKHDSNHGAV